MTKQRKSVKQRKQVARQRERAAQLLFQERHDAMQAKLQKVEREIKMQFAAANSLDLVIAMDCTGSMSPWIQEAKRSILSIIATVKEEHIQATVRVGFVAYRDFCDGADRLEVRDLTEDVTSICAFINTLRAFGGGDTPEDVAGGLEAVLSMKFTSSAKRMILVADSPCHGEEFHNSADDLNFQAEIAASPCIKTQMRSFAERGIDVTFIEINPPLTSKMVAILQREYKSATAFDEFEREFCKISLSQSGDVLRFGEVVAKSASSSLSASKMRSVVVSEEHALGVSSLHHYGPTGDHSTRLDCISGDCDKDEDHAEIDALASVSPPPPHKALDWSELDHAPSVSAIRHTYHFRQGAHVDWANIDLKHTTQDTTIKLLSTCFAKGAMRSAHAMYDEKMKKRFVAKLYYGKAAHHASQSLENDVKTQIVAKRLATEFTLLPQVEDGVDFIFTSLYEILDSATLDLSVTMFTAEPYIAGAYKKYNNNNGWITNREHGSLRERAQAFSHFTWQRTSGQLMVVDLQGVGCIFTDPQVHSVDRRAFSRGNLSKDGMAAFFYSHKCNEICFSIALRPFGRKKQVSKPRANKAVTTDKPMMVSCPLCGAILEVLRSEFVSAHRLGRDVFCDDCAEKVDVREPRECVVCCEELLVSTYWYHMKGMNLPTTCKKCKAVAARIQCEETTTKADEVEDEREVTEKEKVAHDGEDAVGVFKKGNEVMREQEEETNHELEEEKIEVSEGSWAVLA